MGGKKQSRKQKTGAENTVFESKVVGFTPEGQPYYGLVPVHSGQPPSIDEVAPPGLEGVQLSTEKPQPKAEIVAGGGGRERWFPSIELGLTRHDRGLDTEDGE